MLICHIHLESSALNLTRTKRSHRILRKKSFWQVYIVVNTLMKKKLALGKWGIHIIETKFSTEIRITHADANVWCLEHENWSVNCKKDVIIEQNLNNLLSKWNRTISKLHSTKYLPFCFFRTHLCMSVPIKGLYHKAEHSLCTLKIPCSS